jgi:uncharacterized membrane protein (DUF4010 family)
MLGAMSIVGGGAAFWLARKQARRGADDTPQSVSNPFRLRSAILFGLLFALVMLVVRAVRDFFGTAGLFVVAAASGLTDVDAISLALARSAVRDEAVRDAAAGIGLAIVTNTLVKLGIAVSAGEGKFRWQVGLALSAMGLAGLGGAGAVYFGAFG